MMDFGGFTAEVFSGVAVVVSGYSLWQTSLRQPQLRVYVPPLIRYASPYQNSIFEVFEVPLTIVNEGARTGSILSIGLEVSNRQRAVSKKFYSGGLGSWSIGKVKGDGLSPFTPLSLPGHASHSAVVLFYAREDSQVMQVTEDAGLYTFEMSLLTAHGKNPQPLKFEMKLPYMDHRAFTVGSGTLALHHPQWKPSVT
jgi:hypothetical protein